jgi:TolB-like protein/Flp pilus assembly protein TadD
MSERNFFAELKRRNVYKVAVAYAVVGWLVVEIATATFPVLEIPNWAAKLVIAVVALGFPIALVLAWAFELTPEGIKKTEDVPPAESIAPRTGRRLWLLTALAAVAAATLFAMGFFFRGGTSPAPHTIPAAMDKSIAVLPFENLSDDKANAYFASGIQDEILTKLAKIGALKVISRSSTRQYESRPGNLREIGQQLGVAHILEGSVQKAGDRVHLNVQLIRAATDEHIWAESYNRKLDDIFAVQAELAGAVADALQAKLTGAEKKAIEARPTENPEAYQLYLQGRFFWNKRTADDLRKAIDHFQRAIAKDPSYAQAYAAAAQAWVVLPAYNGGPPDECFPEAERAAKKALSLDETSSEAHAALAMVRHLYEFDVRGAIAEFERAIRLNPNDATARHWFGNHALVAVGQFDRAIAEIKRALVLDPLSLIMNTNLGSAYTVASRFEDAIAQLRKTVEMDGTFYAARVELGNALLLSGRTTDALAEYEKALSINDDPWVKGLLGHAYARSGRKDEARALLTELLRAAEQNHIEAYNIAIIHLGLGEREEAVEWLEQGYRNRDGFSISWLRADPFLAPLHGDPRFEALAEKIVPARDFKSAEFAK